MVAVFADEDVREQSGRGQAAILQTLRQCGDERGAIGSVRVPAPLLAAGLGQAAKVGYLVPASAASFAPESPLRSNSSSNCSRRAGGVTTRPMVSDLSNGESFSVVVIAAML